MFPEPAFPGPRSPSAGYSWTVSSQRRTQHQDPESPSLGCHRFMGDLKQIRSVWAFICPLAQGDGLTDGALWTRGAVGCVRECEALWDPGHSTAQAYRGRAPLVSAEGPWHRHLHPPHPRHLAVRARGARLEVQGQIVHAASALLRGRTVGATGNGRCGHWVLLSQRREKLLAGLGNSLTHHWEKHISGSKSS